MHIVDARFSSCCVALQIGLVLLDEVHLLNESGRGSSLEAGCVCRIKAMAAFPELSNSHIASVRFVAVSATIPNFGDVGLVTDCLSRASCFASWPAACLVLGPKHAQQDMSNSHVVNRKLKQSFSQ